MPEVTYTTAMSLSREAIWEFVQDMNNWAPFVTGYQSHEIVDDTDSIWVLKGDVGILKRIVKLRAHITEWDGPNRVEFTLTGLNEKVDGGGVLIMDDASPEEDGGAGAETEAQPKPKKRWFLPRFFYWLARRLFRRIHGAGPQRALPAVCVSRLTFRLRMDAGGPTGPLVNAMLGPALMPAAEDLANKIAAHLEELHGAPVQEAA